MLTYIQKPNEGPVIVKLGKMYVNIGSKSVALASQTAILYQAFKQKNHAWVSNTFRAPQNQANFQFSVEFASVIQ